MYKSIMIAAWATLILVVVTALAAEQSTSQVWIVSNLSGPVTVSTQGKNGSVLPGVKTGDRLHTPFSVKTGDTGNVTVTHGEDRVSVGPNAHLVFPADRKATTGNTVRIDQRLGSVLYKVEHRKQDTFSVETPYLVSVVKGTVFTITTSAEDSTVALMEGSLQVTTPDRQHELLLEPGQVAVKARTGARILLLDEQKPSAPEEGPVTLDQHNGKSQKTVDIRARSMAGSTVVRLSGNDSEKTLSRNTTTLTTTVSGDLSADTNKLSRTGGDLTSTVGDLTGTATGDLTGSVGDLTGTTSGDLTSSVGDLTGTTSGDLTSSVGDLTGTATGDLTSTVGDLTSTATDDLTNVVTDVTDEDTSVINTITQGLLK